MLKYSLTLALMLTTPALAQQPLNPVTPISTAVTTDDGAVVRSEDVIRWTSLNEAFGNGMRAAMAGGAARDVADLAAAMAGAAQPAPQVAPESLTGEWSCRMFKLGGITPLTAYAPFKCRITQASGALVFEKTSGSQQTRGAIHMWDNQHVYLGTGFIQGDTPPDYAALPEVLDLSADPQRTAEIGLLETVSPNKARLLLPYPQLESVFNVLSLSR